MTAELFHNARTVTVAHVIVIALALTLPRFAGCARPQPIVMPTELVVEIPPELIGPPEQKPTPEPSDAPSMTLKEKKEEPKPPPKQEKKPDKKPDKPAPKPRQPKVGQFTSAKKPKRTLTAEEIRKLLELGAKPVEDASKYVNDTMYFEIIRRTMYAAWLQPKTAAGLTTTMLFRLNEDGTIADWNIVDSSGNAVMDSSVAAAAKSVRRIPGLPEDFVKRNRSVTVDFKLSADGRL